jgi:phage-related minor tail protein
MSDDTISSADADEFSGVVAGLQQRTEALTVSANGFASAMTRAFSQSAAGGRQFDDVVKSLGLRLSSLVVAQAFKPLASGISGGLNQLFSGLFGGGSGNALAMASGGIKPFAAGGVIGTPSYFPLSSGGVGLAGEAGPEAIMPLARGPDGRLGVAGGGGGGRAGANVTVQISTPDAESFRRSETYLTGQIARAVARGQRGL